MPTNYEIPFRNVYVGLGCFTDNSNAKLETSGKHLTRLNSRIRQIHSTSNFISIQLPLSASKIAKNVIMSKYSLARKLFGLEESDPDDSERSVIYISSIKIALQIQSSLWLELRVKSPPAPC